MTEISNITTGNWMVDPENPLSVISEQIPGNTYQHICTCDYGFDNPAKYLDLNRANARLIALAPALFKALEAWAFADADPAAAERKGYYADAERQRDAVLRQLGSNAVRP
jgi:hypothetical protein